MSSTTSSGTRSPTDRRRRHPLRPLRDDHRQGRPRPTPSSRASARASERPHLRYPNRGRDVLPFVHLVNAGVLDGYAAVCKLHTKRSPHREDGDTWRRHLIGDILPEGRTGATLARFLALPDAGDLGRRRPALPLARMVGLNAGAGGAAPRPRRGPPRGDLAFPAGSMLLAEAFDGRDRQGADAPTRGVRRRGRPARRHLRPRLRARPRLPRRRRRPQGGRDRRDPGRAPTPGPTRRGRPIVSAFYLRSSTRRARRHLVGQGLYRWTAVTRARPAFAGHLQPFLPPDLGFYDLRVPETMGEQWRLAEARHRRLLRLPLLVRRRRRRRRRILEKPLDDLCRPPDIPFRY